MPELLPLTGSAIADYQEHLAQYPETDPVILAYLTRHINGLMCAEIEQAVTRFVCERMGTGHSDEQISTFFPNFLDSRRISSVRNARFDQIRTTLSSFGLAYRDRFDYLVSQAMNTEETTMLNTAVKKRNDDAHSIPPTVRFEEVTETYRVASAIVDAVRLTLET